MPRMIRSAATFETMEDEVVFTSSALGADPDAADLVPMTAPWLGMIDEVRAGDRKARLELGAVDAVRVVANGRLDPACTTFADELYLAVGKDRKAARWTQFFAQAPAAFVRQALGRQVATVRGWLGAGRDAVLDKHRPELDRWSKAADEAVVKTRGSADVRGQVWQRREELCDNLTRERDGLHDALSARARERGLPRSWPDLFFRVSRRESDATTPADAPPATPPVVS